MKVFVCFFFIMLGLGFASDEKIGTYERLGKSVPLDLMFMNEKGETKSLGAFMEGKPTVISLNYFSCPGICGPQIDGIVKSLNKIQLIEGKAYKALTISFDANDTANVASESKKNHLRVMRSDFNQDAWNFLIPQNQETIDALASSLGFEYKKIINPQGFVDYIHPAGLAILSPQGKITRYLNGIKYLHFDVKMALLEATEEKVRPTISKALSFCFSFDPENSKYVLAINKIFAIIMLIVIGALFTYLLIAGRKRKKEMPDA